MSGKSYTFVYKDLTTGKRDGLLQALRLQAHDLRVRMLGETDNPMIFVLGTGRSGTHWIAWILEEHPDIKAIIEKPPIFNWIVEMAINEAAEPILFPKLAQRYRAERSLASPRHLLDKSHPNLWIADRLAETFPNSHFLAVRRSVYGTVASMLQHTTVRRWVEQWEDLPVPNRFLGIGTDNVEAYRAMSVAGRCALRWLAHERRLDELQPRLGSGLLQIKYEDLHERTDEVLERLRGFLGLERPIPAPTIRRESKEKWRSELTERDIADIDDALATAGAAAPAAVSG